MIYIVYILLLLILQQKITGVNIVVYHVKKHDESIIYVIGCKVKHIKLKSIYKLSHFTK